MQELDSTSPIAVTKTVILITFRTNILSLLISASTLSMCQIAHSFHITLIVRLTIILVSYFTRNTKATFPQRQRPVLPQRRIRTF